MNYSSINNLLPTYFRIVGYAIALLTLLIGIYIKASTAQNSLYFQLPVIQIIFFVALLIVISSKDKTEDERIVLIRQQVWNHGYWMMIGFIIGQMILSHLGKGIAVFGGTISMLTGIAIFQTMIFEMSKNGNLMDWIENNKFKYYSISALILLSFYVFNQWFWYAEMKDYYELRLH